MHMDPEGCHTTLIVALNIIDLYINKEAIVVMVPPINMVGPTCS